MLVLPMSPASPGLKQPGDEGVNFLWVGTYHSSGLASVGPSPGASPLSLVLGTGAKAALKDPVLH